MKTTFLDYSKLILSKVSFDQELLRKEYRKALRNLSAAEAIELTQWANARGLSLREHLANSKGQSGWARV